MASDTANLNLLPADDRVQSGSPAAGGRVVSFLGMKARPLSMMCMLGAVFVLIGVVQLLLLRHVSPHILAPKMQLQEPKRDPSVRFWVDDYLGWHRTQRGRPGARLLIYNTVKAGLGDNIRGLMRTYSFAVLTRRVILVNWVHPYPLASVIGEEPAKMFLLKASDLEPGEKALEFHYYRMRTSEFYAALRSERRAISHGCGPRALIHDVLPELRTPHWEGVPVPPFNDAARRAIARKMYAPSADASTRHTELLDRYALCTASTTQVCPNYGELSRDSRKRARQYIAVHVRLGIGTGEYSTLRFRVMRGNETRIARCFARRVRQLSYEMGDAGGKVLLATDTPSFQTIFRNQMRVLLPKAEVFMYNSRVTHYAGIPANSSSGMRNFMQLWTEMRLLGDAEHIVSFHSGYSLCGYWMGKAVSLITIPHSECGLESEF